MVYLDERIVFNINIGGSLVTDRPQEGMYTYKIMVKDGYTVEREHSVFIGNLYYQRRQTITLDVSDIIRNLWTMRNTDFIISPLNHGISDFENIISQYWIEVDFGGTFGTKTSNSNLVAHIWRYPNGSKYNKYLNGSLTFFDSNDHHIWERYKLLLQGEKSPIIQEPYTYNVFDLVPHYPYIHTDNLKFACDFQIGSQVNNIPLVLSDGEGIIKSITIENNNQDSLYDIAYYSPLNDLLNNNGSQEFSFRFFYNADSLKYIEFSFRDINSDAPNEKVYYVQWDSTSIGLVSGHLYTIYFSIYKYINETMVGNYYVIDENENEYNLGTPVIVKKWNGTQYIDDLLVDESEIICDLNVQYIQFGLMDYQLHYTETETYYCSDNPPINNPVLYTTNNADDDGNYNAVIAEFDLCPARYYLQWKDRFGSYQCQPFRDNITYSEDLKNEEIVTYEDKRKISHILVQPKWKINSGWLNERIFMYYESIFVSPVLYLYDTETELGHEVVITGNWIEKNYNNQKGLVSLELNLEAAETQNIVY